MNDQRPNHGSYFMSPRMSRMRSGPVSKSMNVETFLPPKKVVSVEPEVEESIRLSPKMELAIVSGLGLLIIASPAIIEFFRRKAEAVKIRFISLKDSLNQAEFARKLAVLHRRWKKGSTVRVIGSVLPNFMFTPPCRIYIPKWAQLPSNQWSIHPLLTELTTTRNPDLPSENDAGDGLIEAFEIDSEVISSVSGIEDEDDDGSSSTPEGWTNEQRLIVNFNPTMNATDASFTRCSTPKSSKRRGHFTLSQVPSQNSSKLVDVPKQEEIEELKKMVTLAMFKINQLENCTLQGQETLPVATSSMQLTAATLNSPTTEKSSIPPIPPPMPRPSVSSAPSGPPPPPPPPMPPMPQDGSKKLVISKKGNQDKLIQKKPQMSLSDVLKELPNAKLRRVERSPGGTPIKPQLKLANEGAPLDIGSQLAFALKKRYESMHSPACESDVDKENMDGSGDSFDDDNSNSSASPAKRVLFPASSGRSPRKRSGNFQENRLPFGQHLLKKRNGQQGSTDVSPLAASPLREQN